jgi:hypothetical protein
MVMRTTVVFMWSLVAALGAIAQIIPAEEKPTIEKVRALHLPYAAGPVPVYYSAGFEARAQRYQKAIMACQRWYVVQNLSSKAVKVTSGKAAPLTVASNSWYTFGAPSGTFMQIDTDVCFVFGDEPSIARITTR